MAIIYSYPEKITPAGEDLLVITDSAQPAPNKNRTKSLTIDNLAAYVVSSTSGITGSGTINTVPVFTGATSIGDSGLVYTTTGGGSGGNLPLYAFGGSADITTQRIILSDIFCNNISATGGGTVTLNGNTVIGDAITDTLTVNASSTFNADPIFTTQARFQGATSASFSGTILDGGGGAGAAGQVLSSTGTGVSWISDGGGTVTSVALTMPAAFSVAGSPITSSGTFAVTGAGTASQVILGNGTLGSLPGGPFLPLAGGTMLGNTLHGDNIKSIYGTGSDLEIYHDGSNSYIESKTASQNLILNINELNGTEKFKVVDTNSSDSLMELSHFNFTIYNDGSEVIKATNADIQLTNSLDFKSYTATAVSTTGPIDPIQNNYAPTQDTLATLCVDTSGNVVRGEQEATFTFTTAQLNGTLGQTLISAPGAGKAVVVTYTDYMMTYTTTGSTTNDLEIRQANLASPTASVSRLPALRFNEIVNNSQAGVAPFYGFYTRDIPTGAGSQGRTYSVNSPTTIGKVNAGTWPAGLTSVSIKIRYRVFDVATF